MLRLRAQTQLQLLCSGGCSRGEGFDFSAQHKFSGTENQPGTSPLCQEPGWFCLEAAWACSCGFLGCEGCFSPEQAELCGTPGNSCYHRPLLTPVNTIPTPKLHSCSLALPASPFLAQRCHCTVPELLFKQTHPQRQGLLPPSAPGQGNTSQTPISCWNMARWESLEGYFK